MVFGILRIFSLKVTTSILVTYVYDKIVGDTDDLEIDRNVAATL